MILLRPGWKVSEKGSGASELRSLRRLMEVALPKKKVLVEEE